MAFIVAFDRSFALPGSVETVALGLVVGIAEWFEEIVSGGRPAACVGDDVVGLEPVMVPTAVAGAVVLGTTKRHRRSPDDRDPRPRFRHRRLVPRTDLPDDHRGDRRRSRCRIVGVADAIGSAVQPARVGGPGDAIEVRAPTGAFEYDVIAQPDGGGSRIVDPADLEPIAPATGDCSPWSRITPGSRPASASWCRQSSSAPRSGPVGDRSA